MNVLRFFYRCGVVLSLLWLTSACNANSQVESQDEAEAQSEIQQPKQVVALGKLIPKGEVIKLSVANAEDSRVNQILVAEGDRVKEGQVIAILQGFENRQRDLEKAAKRSGVSTGKTSPSQRRR